MLIVQYLTKCLFCCLHLLSSSDLLFSRFRSPKLLIMNSYFVRHNLQQFTLGLLSICFSILHSVIGDFPSFFNFQIYFDNSVLFSYFLYLKSLQWLAYRCLKVPYVRPICHFSSSLLPSVLIFASYIAPRVRNFFIQWAVFFHSAFATVI